MKLLFIHTGLKLKKSANGNLYINGEYSKNVLQRYIDIADQLTIIFRVEDTIYDEKILEKEFKKFDYEKIKLIEYENIRSSIRNFISIKKRLENNKNIKKAIQNSDKIIVRLPSDAGLSVMKYAKKYNKKYMGEVVGCVWDSMWNYGIKGKLLAPYKFLSTRKVIKKLDYVLYVTNNFLQKRYPNKNHTLGCSDVDINELNHKVLEMRKKKIKQMKNFKHLSIGTVAAVDVKYKGQKYVIKAMSVLKKEGYSIKYYVIGGGNNKTLKNIAKKYDVEKEVIFVGAVPHNEVFEYLDKIDIYIQPSKQEGLCRAIVEAMSRACPVIASNAGGNSELIENEYIFKKGNHKELTKIIKGLNQNKLKSMAKVNYNRAKQYTRSELEKKREKFYKQYINEN